VAFRSGFIGLEAGTGVDLIYLDFKTCKCDVSNPSLYCGYCPQVTGSDVNVRYAYECALNGRCSSYGRSSRCTKYNGRYCVGCDTWAECDSRVLHSDAEVAEDE